jgi:hypothetical protein
VDVRDVERLLQLLNDVDVARIVQLMKLDHQLIDVFEGAVGGGGEGVPLRVLHVHLHQQVLARVTIGGDLVGDVVELAVVDAGGGGADARVVKLNGGTVAQRTLGVEAIVLVEGQVVRPRDVAPPFVPPADAVRVNRARLAGQVLAHQVAAVVDIAEPLHRAVGEAHRPDGGKQVGAKAAQGLPPVNIARVQGSTDHRGQSDGAHDPKSLLQDAFLPGRPRAGACGVALCGPTVYDRRDRRSVVTTAR